MGRAGLSALPKEPGDSPAAKSDSGGEVTLREAAEDWDRGEKVCRHSCDRRLSYQSARRIGLNLMQKKIAKSIVNDVFITIPINISSVLSLRLYLEACYAGFIGYYL